MIAPQDSLIVPPNTTDIIGHAPDPLPQYKGIDQDLGMLGGTPNVLPPQQGYDPFKSIEDFAAQPASLETRMQPIQFDWKASDADRFTQSDYYRTEGFHPYSGSVETPYGTNSYNEEHYGQMQTFGNTMKKAVGGFAALTAATFTDSAEGTGRLINTLFNWNTDKSWKETLIGSPEELALKDEQQKAIFNKYAIFHTAESNATVFNKQLLGDMITQAGFTVGPMAEFLVEQGLTMGISGALTGFAKGTRFAATSLKTAEVAERAIPLAERINDSRKAGSMTSNTSFFTEMIGGLKNVGKWSAKQLNPMTGVNDILQTTEAGTGAWNIGITTVGAAKRVFGQANMAFNEARFEAAGTYGQMLGDMVKKFEEQNGRSPEQAELDNMQKYAYGAATDNFIVNSGIIMGMNAIQFGNMFSKFSSTSKLLREAMETGSDVYTVSGKIGGKAATRAYSNAGIFANPISTFRKVRKDFGIGTALATVGKRAVTGTAAKFELFEGLQELLQTGSDNALREYYTNLYDGRTDIHGARLADVNWEKGMTDQYNLDGWKTFLMGAVTGMLISPVQASVMYASRKGYARVNDQYKQEVDGYQKAVQDNVDKQNAFYSDINKGLNDAIKNWKLQANASKTMEEALQNGDKYTFFNAKDDSFAATVNAAIKTNTLPSLVDSIKEFAEQMSPQEIAEAFPGIVKANQDPASLRNFLVSVANDIEEYHSNWERLKEQYAHLVMPEVYKANKEDYAKALMAKRALDEAIEVLATTDYKATRALTRAGEIKSKIASVPGLGNSAAEAFDILLSDNRSALKIEELEQLLSVGEGIEQSKEEKKLSGLREKQIDALKRWTGFRLMQEQLSKEWKKDKKGFDDAGLTQEAIELNNKMAQAFEDYVIAHNSMAGPYNDVVDKSALKNMFGEFGQYIALNRDAGHYLEAMNVLSDPRNFEHSYAIMKGTLEYANEKLKEANTKEAKEKIDKDFGVTNTEEEGTEQDTTEETTNEEQGDTTADTEDSTQDSEEQPQGEETTEEETSTTTPEPQPLKNYPTKIWRLDDTIRIVPGKNETPTQERKRNEILASTPADVLRAGMKVRVTRNETVTEPKQLYSKEGGTTPYVKVNGQTYAIQVYYNDTMLGWLSEPYGYTFDFGNGTIPADQLKRDQFPYVVHIPKGYTPEQAYTEFQTNYAIGAEFKRNLDNLMKGKDSIELQGTEIPFIPVISEGSIDTIPEKNYEQRDTLGNILKEHPEFKLVGVYDQAQQRIIGGQKGVTISDAEKADSKDILGNYKVGIQLANGAIKWVQGKGKPYTNEQIADRLERVQQEQKKIQTLRDKGTVPTENDIRVANELLDIFITARPVINAKFYLSLEKDGKFKLTRYTYNKGGEKNIISTHSFDKLPTDPKKFREFLTKELKKHLTKEPNGVSAEDIEKIEVNENNLRENLPTDASVDDVMRLQLATVPGIVKDVVLTYITAEPVQRKTTNMPPVEEVVPATAPIEGGGTYVVPSDITDAERELIVPIKIEPNNLPVDKNTKFKEDTPLYQKDGTLWIVDYVSSRNPGAATTRVEKAGTRESKFLIDIKEDLYEKDPVNPPIIADKIVEIQKKRASDLLFKAQDFGKEVREYSYEKEYTEGYDKDIFYINVKNNKTNEYIINIKGYYGYAPLEKEVSDTLKRKGYTDEEIKRIENNETPVLYINPTKEELNAKYDAEILALKQSAEEPVVLKSLATPTQTTDDVDSLQAEMAGNRSTKKVRNKWARKVLTTEDAARHVENMQKFRNWMTTNLPQISVEEVDGIIENLNNGSVTVGQFLMNILDTGNLRGTIKTSPNAAYKYHEAFHGVFRMLLSQDRIDRLFQQAAKESPVTAEKLQSMRNLHPEYATMSEPELIERYYEEYLADKFDTWMNDRSVRTGSGIKEFFARLWDWIREVVARLTGNDIQRLFYQVDRGAMMNVQVQTNQFTDTNAFITTVSSARKVIPLYEQEINTPDGPVTAMKYLPQSVADTLSSTIAALYFKSLQTESQHNKRELLDSIISKYADLYNPRQQKYRDMKAAISDPHRADLWWRKLNEMYFVFTNPDAKQSLMEAVDVHLRIAGLKQDLEDDAHEDLEAEVGSRNTDNFNRDLGTAGDYGSLAKYLRQYIAGTTINYTDEYGNSEFADGTPLVQAVNANNIYNGLLKVLANSTDETKLLQRLDRFHKYGNNPDTNAFIQNLKDDTGLQVNEDGTFSINREGNEILIQQILKGFGQYEVDHIFTLVKDGNEYVTMSANRQNAATNQLNLWNRAYEQLFWNKVEIMSSNKDKRDYARTAYQPLQRLEDILREPDKKITNTRWESVSLEISNEIKSSLGINLHPVYIQYSIAAGKSPEARTKVQQEIVEDYNGVDPVSIEILNAIRPNLYKENLFSKTASTQEGLDIIATGNSYFDETVNTMSYTTADGETVYAHQLPSYYSVELYKLNDQAVIEADKVNVDKSSSYLLSNENFLHMSKKGMIRMISTDGLRQETEDSAGIVYGDFNGREQNAYLLGMYGGARKIRRGKEHFWVSPTMVRTVEAKNSAPFVDLPVIGSYIDGKLSTVATEQMLNTIRAEVDRIERVKKEIKDRKVKKIDGYHTGAKRGLHLFESAKMVGDLKDIIESGTIDEAAITEQLNRYWNDQIDEYIGLMLSQGLIGVGPNGEFVNRLAPSYLFTGMEGSEKGTELNLIPGNFRHNLGQVLINDYLNTTAINTLLRGNEAKLFKDSVDQNKRAAGEAGMGPSMQVVVTCPKWGIDAPLSTVHHVTYRTHEGKDLFGNKIDTDDAQMYITEKALRYMLFGFGKLNQTQVDILDQLRAGTPVTAEQFYGAGGLKSKGPFNSYKLLHYDGETYIKCSAIPLFRDMVSIDQGGEWVANPEFQKLHELLDKMEQQEQEQEVNGNNIVVFAHPDTASKSMKQGVVNDIEDITANSYNAIPASYTRLQLENPSNKTVITDPTQAKQQIMAEQDDTAIVSFMGVDKTVGEVKDAYMRAVAQRKTNNYNSAVNEIFDMDGAYIELQKSIDMQKVTPKLGKFLLHAQDILMATGTDSHTMGFYEVDENRDPMYNLNFPSLLPKFTEMFLSYFSKGVLSEKVPGTSVALVSDYGVMKFKKVTSIWQEGDQGYLPEYAGQPKTWQVITTAEVKKDPGYYALNAKKYISGQEDKRLFSDVQVGDIIQDTLRHNYPKYDSNGRYLGRFSEFLMPAQYAEIMNGIPDAYKYMMGVRIPSDDKHSYISLEYVDTLPVQLGSVAIFPRELIRISGADFDIDKVYLEWLDTYKSQGTRVQYGTADTVEGQFQEFVTWQLENNKGVKESVSESLSNDSEFKDLQKEYNELVQSQSDLVSDITDVVESLQTGTIELSDRILTLSTPAWIYKHRKDQLKQHQEGAERAGILVEQITTIKLIYALQAMKEQGLPVTSKAFKDKGGIDLNNGVQNNIALQSKITMLNNEFISGDTVEKGKSKASILNQSTSTDILKDLVKTLKKKFSDMQNDENRSEEDKAGIQKILSTLSDPVADTNSLLGKVMSYTNNKEGSRNIGAAVNAMLTYSILNTNKVELNIPVRFDGKMYDKFIEHTTSDNIRKFAQISALVNAMTDNAKDPLAAKLGLNIEAVGLVAAMVSIGIPTESAVLLMLQPAVREYFRQVQTLSGQLKTGEELNQSTFSLLPDMIKSYKGPDDKKTFNTENLTTEAMYENIASDGKDESLQLGALLLLSDIKRISDHMRKVAGVTKLSKGLPTSFAEVDKIVNTLDTISTMEGSETPPPFNVIDILTYTNKIVATDIKIMMQVLELSTKVFTERTLPVRQLTEDVLSMMKVSEGVSGEPFRKQLRDDIISYLDIAEYMKLLQENERVGTLQTLHHGLIYDGQGIETIHQIVNRLRDKLKDSVEEGNYLVDKYLFLLNSQQSKSGINEVQANIWAKMSQAVQERLGAAFMDLYSNSHKSKTTGEAIDTYQDAMALFHYLLVKDGGQFRNNSFIKYIPNIVFDNLLTAAGNVNKDLSGSYGISLDMRENFIDSYGQHINNKNYIQAIQGNPEGYGWLDNNYMVRIPNYVFENELGYYGGFRITDGVVTFPTYMKQVTQNDMGYTNETLLKLVSTYDSEGNEIEREEGTTSSTGVGAKYEKVQWRGSVGTWKGAGLYGQMPRVEKGGVVQTANNPGYSTTSPEQVQQEQQVQNVTVLPTEPVDWFRYLVENYGTPYPARNEHTGTVTWMIQGKGSDTPMKITQYSPSGRANTPQELYTELTGNQIGDSTIESQQPVVPSQSMEPTVQQPTVSEPVVSIEPGRYVQYQDSTYIVTKQNANGTWQIYDPTKEGTAAKKSVSDKNLTPTANKGSIVTYKDKEYIVTPKETIISLATNKKMEWGPENGDRKNILQLTQEQSAVPVQMSGAEWKEQLHNIYTEKGDKRGRNEREWTLAALQYRNTKRSEGISDEQIIQKIKDCI